MLISDGGGGGVVVVVGGVGVVKLWLLLRLISFFAIAVVYGDIVVACGDVVVCVVVGVVWC